MRLSFRAAAAAIAFLFAAPLFSLPVQAQTEPVVVFAAASLKNALDEAAQTWAKKSGIEVKLSYAASSALAKQIEAGAPADIFISADLDWMDYVQKRNLIQPATRKNLLGNELVMVAPK